MNSAENTQRNTCLAMPFPASIALAVLKVRTKITENNKNDSDQYNDKYDNNNNDNNVCMINHE